MHNGQIISSELCSVARESCLELFYKYVGLPQLTSDIPPTQLEVFLQIASFQMLNNMLKH